MRSTKTSLWLGYLGLIPFVAAVLGFVFTQDYPQALSQHGFLIYSLAILCFLAGSAWGEALRGTNVDLTPRLLVSNGIVLFAVTAMLTANPFWSLILLAFGYFAYWGYERRVIAMAEEYRVMRARLTSIVVALHLCFAALVSMPRS